MQPDLRLVETEPADLAPGVPPSNRQTDAAQEALVERITAPMGATIRAVLLTVGVAAATGLCVLTGKALGMHERGAVLFAIPVGAVVGFLFSLILILMPSWASRRHHEEMAQRIARVAKVAREGGFDELLEIDDEHELRLVANTVHEALKTAHADRLEAARLRRDMEARIERRTKANTAHLAKLSTTDELTGLLNRRGLDNALEAFFLDRHDCREDLAMVAIDLDHFKRLNDTCGHDKGDLALKAAGELMNASIRSGDAAARAGGDELFLLLRGVTPEGALQAASRLADNYARHPDAAGLPWPTMSIGIALAKRHKAQSPQHLKQLADVALYAGKRSGRAQCVMYDPGMNPASSAA